MLKSGPSERVRRLDNTNAPVNTLDGPSKTNAHFPRTSFSSTDSLLPGGSKRRQNSDRELTYENRTTKRHRANPTPTRGVVRLSQDDTDDVESVGKSTVSNDGSTPKKNGGKNHLRQNELRSSGIGTPKHRRDRRKRSAGATGRRTGGSIRRNPEVPVSASPDELRNSSPPPVQSDLLPSKPVSLSKYPRPVPAPTKSSALPFEADKHRRKNAFHEDISDDELANNDAAKQDAKTKPQESSSNARARPARTDSKIRLRQAVSGIHIFQPENVVELVQDDSRSVWSLVTEEGKPIGHPWLRIDVRSMLKINYSPDCEIVIITRSKTKTIPAMLVLQFEHNVSSEKFALEVKKNHETVKIELKTPEYLREVCDRRVNDARHGHTRAPTSDLTAQESLEPESCNVTSPSQGQSAQRSDASAERQVPKTRLVDRLLLGTGEEPVSQRCLSPPSKTTVPLTRRATRQSAPEGLFADDELFYPRWSLENTGWKKAWDRELVYPSTGRNRAIVHKEDIQRLDEGAFLNDSLVFFYLRYLQIETERQRPDISRRIYFMNTYFFEILRKGTGGSINYEGVKSWTSKVDIFSYDYIVVPVNEEAHWYLAIICSPGVVLRVDQDTDDDVVCLDTHEKERRDSLASPRTRRRKEVESHSSPPPGTKNSRTIRDEEQSGTAQEADARDIRIITLDSLGASHSKTCQMLRKYLVEEAKFRKNVDRSALEKRIGLTAKHIPSQANFCDCGVFLLGYAQHFVKDPDGFVATILARRKPEWTVDASQLRTQIRETLFRLHNDYRVELAERKRKKRKAKLGEGKQEATMSSDTPVSEAQGGLALNEQASSNSPQPTSDGDAPLSTPAGEHASGDLAVDTDPVNQKADVRANPLSSSQSSSPVEKNKSMPSPKTDVRSQKNCSLADTSHGDRNETMRIRESIEYDGDRCPSSSPKKSSSPDASLTHSLPVQLDDKVHSSSVPSPLDTGVYEVPESPPPPAHPDQPANKLNSGEPKFVQRLPSSPVTRKSSGSPELGERSPLKRGVNTTSAGSDNEAPRASKRVKETDTKSRYFDGGEVKFVPRQIKYDSRAFQPKKPRHGSSPRGGKGRRSSDAIDLTE